MRACVLIPGISISAVSTGSLAKLFTCPGLDLYQRHMTRPCDESTKSQQMYLHGIHIGVKQDQHIITLRSMYILQSYMKPLGQPLPDQLEMKDMISTATQMRKVSICLLLWFPCLICNRVLLPLIAIYGIRSYIPDQMTEIRLGDS